MSSTKVYNTWIAMKMRCTNKNNENYERYGGRGISVCKEWFDSFESFYKDIGYMHKDGLELDRIDNNGNYCKENCRWVTRSRNHTNKRNHGEFLKGVYLDKRRNKFASRIKIEGKVYFLGYFDNEIDANLAYREIFKEWYGQDAPR